ncbi:MAG: efflux RND transporter periplasmic adaptor subunit [Candidatus Thiodiazotropha sp.]
MMKHLLLICLLFSTELIARDLEALTDWNNRVELTTLVSGMVTRVNVDVGSKVKRGEVLVELDQRGYQSRIAAAESRLEAASQQNEEAKRELDRALELYDRTLLSDHERKQAEIAAATSDTSYREAEAKLIAIRLQREYSRIAAPFDGVVVSIHVEPGQAVINRQTAMPILTLIDNSSMKAVAEIDAQTIATLRPGMAIKVGVRGEWLDGTIHILGLDPLATDPGGARYRLEALFSPSAEMALRAGEKIVVRLNDE